MNDVAIDRIAPGAPDLNALNEYVIVGQMLLLAQYCPSVRSNREIVSQLAGLEAARTAPQHPDSSISHQGPSRASECFIAPLVFESETSTLGMNRVCALRRQL
jgi:hypothetical protein